MEAVQKGVRSGAGGRYRGWEEEGRESERKREKKKQMKKAM